MTTSHAAVDISFVTPAERNTVMVTSACGLPNLQHPLNTSLAAVLVATAFAMMFALPSALAVKMRFTAISSSASMEASGGDSPVSSTLSFGSAWYCQQHTFS